MKRCLVDVLNNLLDDYKICDFEVAKKLRVFGLQTEGKVLPFLLQLWFLHFWNLTRNLFFNDISACSISITYIVDRGLYCKKTLFQFTLPTTTLDSCYLYEVIGATLSFRDELSKSLSIIQKLKIAKTRTLFWITQLVVICYGLLGFEALSYECSLLVRLVFLIHVQCIENDKTF